MGKFSNIDVMLQDAEIDGTDINKQLHTDILNNVDSIFASMDRMSRSIAMLIYKRISGDLDLSEYVLDQLSDKVKIRLIRELNKLADEHERINRLGLLTYTKDEMNNEVNQ